jgi:ribonuclease HI
LWGVLEGLKYAKRKGYRKIELNINSVAVMKVIKSGKTSNSLGFSLVKSIKKLLDEEREVKILIYIGKLIEVRMLWQVWVAR